MMVLPRAHREQLRWSEEHFRLLVESIEDYAIFMLDPVGHVMTWNPGAERIKGYRAEEILGRSFSVFYPPEEVAEGKPQWLLDAAARLGHVEDEGWRLRKDGSRFWANVVLTALLDEGGALRGFAKITRDMTERRKFEALQEVDRQKDEFLALLGHELRNPLAPIRNALQVLRRSDASEEARERSLAMADRQVGLMARLLDDLLDLSRINGGKLEVRRDPVDVAEALRAAADGVWPANLPRQHELEITLPREPLWVRADPARLEQIFVNLLRNAEKYTDPGGTISVRARREGAAVVVRVVDSGIGIDPLMRTRIFDLFVQENRRGRRPEGLGVGLSLVKRLVEMQGGTVDALSAGPGKGSEFIVRLPAIARPAEPARPGSPAGARPPRRVLVVDDNVDAAEGLALLLELEGHRVARANGGEDALAAARAFRPDAVVLDIGMPGMDGYEVARRLRAEAGMGKLTLVALTGWGKLEDRGRAAEAGFDHHVTKPADHETLLALLRK